MPNVRERLSAARHVDIVAAGKSAHRMLEGMHDVAMPTRHVLCVGPSRPAAFAGVEWYRGAHPIPDETSVRSATRAMTLAREADAADLLLVLLSGGASAMLAAPADGVTLEDKKQTVRTLLAAGATIGELNAVRKHLSAVKGGQLAASTRARVLTLAISDVVGDDPSTIGSGPSVPDPTTFSAALQVIEGCGGNARFPAAVMARLRAGAAGAVAETPKPGADVWARVEWQMIGGVRDALRAGSEAASGLGYGVHVFETPTIGEARVAGASFARSALLKATTDGPVCVLAGGETTVTVRGSGVGGRNQECALGMARVLDETGSPAVAGSIGTDGVDGPTDAAGAVVDATTVSRARERGLDMDAALADNDSLVLLQSLGDLVRTGPTGANVGDIQIMLIDR